MKVVLYMASSLNGFIAKNNDDTSWISKDEWDSYSAFIRERGNMVIGHRTYDILTKQREFIELEEIKLIVVSNQKIEGLPVQYNSVTSPEEALRMLSGFSEVVVAGGAILNSSFMNKSLIDELYIDIEPIIFTNGIPIFSKSDFEFKPSYLAIKRSVTT